MVAICLSELPSAITRTSASGLGAIPYIQFSTRLLHRSGNQEILERMNFIDLILPSLDESFSDVLRRLNAAETIRWRLNHMVSDSWSILLDLKYNIIPVYTLSLLSWEFNRLFFFSFSISFAFRNDGMTNPAYTNSAKTMNSIRYCMNATTYTLAGVSASPSPFRSLPLKGGLFANVDRSM